MTRLAIVSLVAACCVALTACTDTRDDDKEVAPVAEPRPTLAEARDGLTAALAAIEPVLYESIPAEEWKRVGDSYQNGCDTATQGRFVTSNYLVSARYLSEGAWPRIEQALAQHGFRSGSAVPLGGGSGFVHFLNDFGDEITVSSIQPGDGRKGGSGYSGETSCHEGYVR